MSYYAKLSINLVFIASLIVGLICALTGHLPTTALETLNPAGFFAGLLHGFIVVVSAIGWLFNHHISIYAADNTGATYWIGYALGVLSMLRLHLTFTFQYSR